MRKFFGFICLIVTLLCSFSINSIRINAYANENNFVYLGGMPAGFTMSINGACVVGLCDVITVDGTVSPARNAGIEVGDIIKSLDGKSISNANDIENNINKNIVRMEINRYGETLYKEIIPATDLNGNKKLGVFVKDSVSGIGTITFIKDDNFASLGHAVIDENKNILDTSGGNLFHCKITGVVRGERGNAGELKGVFLRSNPIALIEKNTITGVYGKVTENYKTDDWVKIETGEAKVGDATVYTTINGNCPKEYTISIIKYDYFGENKNFVIKVTDKDLLETTGGIVQGMSGSPIIQDGKLVGAVTHVFINDPTRGFGISIDKMINNI